MGVKYMKDFLTVGTSSIQKEFMRPIIEAPNNYSTKPYGGIWLTEYDMINGNEWLMHLLSSGFLFHQKFSKEACVIHLKDDAKILTINTKEDLLKYASIYPNKTQKLLLNQALILLDFQKISQEYDGIYFNARNQSLSQYKDEWAVNSLNLFNLDAIKCYEPLTIGYEDICGGYDKYFFVEDEKPSKEVENKNKYYTLLYEMIKNDYYKFINANPSVFCYNSYAEVYKSIMTSVIEFVEKSLPIYQNILNKLCENKIFVNKGQLIKGSIIYQLMSNTFIEKEQLIKQIIENDTKLELRKSYR